MSLHGSKKCVLVPYVPPAQTSKKGLLTFQETMTMGWWKFMHDWK